MRNPGDKKGCDSKYSRQIGSAVLESKSEIYLATWSFQMTVKSHKPEDHGRPPQCCADCVLLLIVVALGFKRIGKPGMLG